jgi:hypothetical protein
MTKKLRGDWEGVINVVILYLGMYLQGISNRYAMIISIALRYDGIIPRP